MRDKKIIWAIVLVVIIIFLFIYKRYENRKTQTSYENISGYTKDKTALDALDRAIKNQSSTNSFIAAEILSNNIAPNEPEREDRNNVYNKAAELYKHSVEHIQPETFINNTVLGEPYIDPTFILNRTEDFFDTHQVDIPRPNFQFIRQEVRTAKPPELIAPVTITNDPQNVHDSNVNNDVRNILTRLYELTKDDPKLPPEQIKADLLTLRSLSSDQLNKFNMTFDTILKNYDIGNLNIKEGDLLSLVHARAHKINNGKSNLLDNIIDCVETKSGHNNLMCTGGRSTRYLSTFTLIDPDPILSRPIKTADILKKEIFEKANVLLQEELKKLPKDRQDKYNNTGDEQFENYMKDKITNYIIENYHDEDQKTLTNIITDTLTAI